MKLVSLAEAGQRLGVSVDTIKRRLRRGELKGQQVPRPQGYTWFIELPDSPAGDTASQADEQGSSTADASVDSHASMADSIAEIQRMEELVTTLQAQVKAQQEQLEAKDRQISELHVLLQQAQEQASRMLPAPRRRRWWWPW